MRSAHRSGALPFVQGEYVPNGGGVSILAERRTFEVPLSNQGVPNLPNTPRLLVKTQVTDCRLKRSFRFVGDGALAEGPSQDGLVLRIARHFRLVPITDHRRPVEHRAKNRLGTEIIYYSRSP